MKISEAVFAGSSTRISGKPALKLPEFAFIGRSNVGKSSLINLLCARKKLAMTSSTPGKTRLVNHFRINGSWYLVDLPGYGYAKASKSERDAIQGVIRNYLDFSEELVLLFVLVDARHEPQQVDLDFFRRLGECGLPFAVVFTKTDKLGPVALEKKVEAYGRRLLEEWEELPPFFRTSSETGAGREEVLDYIDKVLEDLK